MVKNMGVGSYLVKVDIKSAFRLLPINPSDFNLLGMVFDGNYYVDKSLPFGLSVSCAPFEKFRFFFFFSFWNGSLNIRIKMKI